VTEPLEPSFLCQTLVGRQTHVGQLERIQEAVRQGRWRGRDDLGRSGYHAYGETTAVTCALSTLSQFST